MAVRGLRCRVVAMISWRGTPFSPRWVAAVCLVSALTVFGWVRVAIDLLWRIMRLPPAGLGPCGDAAFSW